jgi:hypothetical protein
VKTETKEKPVAVETLTKEARSVCDTGEESFRSCEIIPRMNQLLDQFKHHQPPSITEWSFFGPSEKLLSLLLAQNEGVPDGLPEDAESLVAWLKVPSNARRVRAAQILISFPPHPRNATTILVRLERAATVDEYRSSTA